MKISQVKITNFRGYKDETIIDFGELTAFVGRNDVGKSTVLEALNCMVRIHNVATQFAGENGAPVFLWCAQGQGAFQSLVQLLHNIFHRVGDGKCGIPQGLLPAAAGIYAHVAKFPEADGFLLQGQKCGRRATTAWQDLMPRLKGDWLFPVG